MKNLSKLNTVATALFFLAVAAGAAQAQTLADRVARVSDGTVRVSFNVTPGICGRGNSIIRGDHDGSTNWGNDYSRDVEWDANCYAGPGRLVLERSSGETVGLRFYVGGRWRPSTDAVDLGNIAAPQVAAYLVNLAETGNGERPA